MRGSCEHIDENRMLSELVSLRVACEDCGRDRCLGFAELSRASFAGAYNFRLLRERLSCSECPSMPRQWRRLRLHPIWRFTKSIA